MFYLVVQTVLLITIAFILGAIVGCLLRRWFTADAEPARAMPRAATAVPAASGAPAGIASGRVRAPHVPDAPLPTVEPKVVPQPVRRAPVPPAPEVAETPTELKQPVTTPSDEAKASVPPETIVGAAGMVGGTVDDVSPKARTGGKPKKAKATGKAKAKAAPPATGEPDNLKLIRGIGPQNESRLNEIGVDRFAQIAAWSKKDQREMGERLSFPGRIEREGWVAQAKQLAKGTATPMARGAGRVKTSSAAGTSAPGSRPQTLDAPRDGAPDDLTAIEGVGNAIERKLLKLGIFHFDQIAGLSEDEAAWVGNEIGFPGRVAREDWTGQAKLLAEGGAARAEAPARRGEIRTRRKPTDGEA